MPNNQQEKTGPNGGKVFFWFLWVLALVLFPFYAFTFLFEADVVKSNDIGSQISPIIGMAVLIAQGLIMVISFKQMKRNSPLSKPYLTLLGGTIIIGFIWAGGCSIMGPFRMM